MKKWSFNTKRDIMLYLFIIVLLIQTLLYVRISESPYLFSGRIEYAESLYKDISDIFIKDTVRAEQRRALVAIRQAWVQYLSVNSDVKLLTDKNEWDIEVVKEIFSIIGEPLRLFDTSSELIVADLQTGNILVAPMLKSDYLSYIMISDKPNLLAYHQLPFAQHKEQVAELYKTILTKIDSDRNTVLTSLLYEQSEMSSQSINDFTLYPLGQYHRQFIEKIILPYESIGVNGLENMQLVVIIGEIGRAHV